MRHLYDITAESFELIAEVLREFGGVLLTFVGVYALAVLAIMAAFQDPDPATWEQYDTPAGRLICYTHPGAPLADVNFDQCILAGES